MQTPDASHQSPVDVRTPDRTADQVPESSRDMLGATPCPPSLVDFHGRGAGSQRNVSTSLRQWLGEFYVAFEPASSSSVVAARWWLLGGRVRLRIRLSALQNNHKSPKESSSRVRPVELVNCAAIQASASERQIHRQVTRSARPPVTLLLGGAARWWLLGGAARWWLLGGRSRCPKCGH